MIKSHYEFNTNGLIKSQQLSLASRLAAESRRDEVLDTVIPFLRHKRDHGSSRLIRLSAEWFLTILDEDGARDRALIEYEAATHVSEGTFRKARHDLKKRMHALCRNYPANIKSVEASNMRHQKGKKRGPRRTAPV